MATTGDPSHSSNVNQIPDYIPYNEKSFQWSSEQDGIQSGDPKLAAKAIIDVVHSALEGQMQWPRLDMLVLGEDAERDIREKCNNVLRNLDETQGIIRSIEFRK